MSPCDDVQLALSCEDELDAPQQAHVASCAACQAHREDAKRVVAAAAMPPMSARETSALASLERSTRAAWAAEHRPPRGFQRVIGYAVAAGVGALVASGAWHVNTPRVEAPVAVAAPASNDAFDLGLTDPSGEEQFADASNFSDDEVFFDVGWPTLE